jgi:hypothetical protein
MSGKCTIMGTILLLALLLPALVPGTGALTRGSTFTVTVIGQSRTAYDIWPKGTSSMSGEVGDQPPIIVAGQTDVVQDPSGGPYVIGSHPISGGGTILGDVPPDSSVTSATSYYAEVTTDASGYGVVLFRTSSATATGQQFHIVAENPADLGEDVKVVLGLPPTPAPVQTPMMPLPLPTTMQTPFIPVTTAAETPPPVQPTQTSTPVTLQTATPTQIPVQETPVAKIPLSYIVGIGAAGIGILWAGRERE